MSLKKDVEEFFDAPAEALEFGVEVLDSAQKRLIGKRPLHIAEEYLYNLGPGLTTGAADDDPSGIATYSQVGAAYGFQFLWLSLFSFPLMAVVQEMCARIALVTGEGLAANIRKRYSAPVLYACALLLFAANTFNLGADLGAMAKATQLLWPSLHFAALVILFAAISLFLQVFTTYARYAKYLKYLTLALFAYVATAFFANVDWHDAIAHTIVPTMGFSRGELLLVCAVLGTTISPYLFFWQTSQEVEEEVLRGEKTVEERAKERPHKKVEIREMRFDVWTGMLFSNLVMFFIIAACAATLFAHGITNIQTADQAAQALEPFAGQWAFGLFALGIIGTGFLAVPVLAGASAYAIAESFRLRTGLYRKLKNAYAFYGVIIVSMFVGLAMNFAGLDPIKALIYSAVGNGLVAPIVLFFVVRLSASKEVMGPHANKKLANWIGWITVGAMALAGLAVIVTL
ncbi:MAG TPA: Nramp family divalent metal transporter [Candidatus Paceibacterota bacterium]|jgi:NRAMP (natural resistance-associated macrophage protein)-like metal ion transporter|nr:Nramp family divalent metal transporter [Candidatus Paceibacterota bacterium]